MAATYWAARFSNDIAADLARGFSWAGWSFQPATSAEACQAQIDEYAGDGLRAYETEPAYNDELGGWLPMRPGLTAFVGDDADEAIERARRDDRFDGATLYVFECEYVSDDEDALVFGSGIERVKPVSAATLVEA